MTKSKEPIHGYYEFKYLFYKNYVQSVTEAFAKDYKKYKRDAEKKIDVGDGIRIFNMMQFAALEIKQEKFSGYFNDSTFIFLYSMFESDIKEICTNAQKVLKRKISVTDIAGANYIEKCRTYLTKIVDIDLDSMNAEWEKMKTYQKIRNYLAHNNSTIPVEDHKPLGSRSEIYKLISTSSDFTLNIENGEFHISSSKFLIGFCDVSTLYLSAIINRMDHIFSKS